MTIELSELRDAAQKAFPMDRLLPPRDESWRIVTENGWLMLTLPEEDGGLGLGPDAAATIHYEIGRILPSAPLMPALLALQAIVSSDELAERADWIERICGGEYVPLNMLPAAYTMRTDGSVYGKISGIFEADMAEYILVGFSDRYALIPFNAPGVRVIERPIWDQSRRLFDVELDGYTFDLALQIAEGNAAKALHDKLSPTAHLALAADSLGGANALLAMTIEYLKTRRQFDRPLAMFQALKHRVADLKVQIAAAEALLWHRASNDTTVLQIAALKTHAVEVYKSVAEDAIQLHGGIGLTEEYPCHHYFKRAFLNASLCGETDYWQERVGRETLAAHD